MLNCFRLPDRAACVFMGCFKFTMIFSVLVELPDSLVPRTVKPWLSPSAELITLASRRLSTLFWIVSLSLSLSLGWFFLLFHMSPACFVSRGEARRFMRTTLEILVNFEKHPIFVFPLRGTRQLEFPSG